MNMSVNSNDLKPDLEVGILHQLMFLVKVLRSVSPVCLDVYISTLIDVR